MSPSNRSQLPLLGESQTAFERKRAPINWSIRHVVLGVVVGLLAQVVVTVLVMVVPPLTSFVVERQGAFGAMTWIDLCRVVLVSVWVLLRFREERRVLTRADGVAHSLAYGGIQALLEVVFFFLTDAQFSALVVSCLVLIVGSVFPALVLPERQRSGK